MITEKRCFKKVQKLKKKFGSGWYNPLPAGAPVRDVALPEEVTLLSSQLACVTWQLLHLLGG